MKSEIELKCDDQWIDLYLGKDILLYEMKNRECYCNDESGKKSNKKKKKQEEKKYIRFYRNVSCELKDRISMIFFKAPIKCGMSFCVCSLAYPQYRSLLRLDLFN